MLIICDGAGGGRQQKFSDAAAAKKKFRVANIKTEFAISAIYWHL